MKVNDKRCTFSEKSSKRLYNETTRCQIYLSVHVQILLFVQLFRWPRVNALDHGARGPEYDSRLWEGFYFSNFCCFCDFSFLVQKLLFAIFTILFHLVFFFCILCVTKYNIYFTKYQLSKSHVQLKTLFMNHSNTCF